MTLGLGQAWLSLPKALYLVGNRSIGNAHGSNRQMYQWIIHQWLREGIPSLCQTRPRLHVKFIPFILCPVLSHSPGLFVTSDDKHLFTILTWHYIGYCSISCLKQTFMRLSSGSETRPAFIICSYAEEIVMTLLDCRVWNLRPGQDGRIPLMNQLSLTRALSVTLTVVALSLSTVGAMAFLCILPLFVFQHYQHLILLLRYLLPNSHHVYFLISHFLSLPFDLCFSSLIASLFDELYSLLYFHL